jgi:glucose/arabinose dehydrogenase
MKRLLIVVSIFGVLVVAESCPRRAAAVDLVGKEAFGDWTQDAPGIRRYIRPYHLPAPSMDSAEAPSTIVPRPAGAELRVPDGFRARLFAEGLQSPRLLRVAPNGDIFVSEGLAGQIRVLRPAADNARPSKVAVFASGLNRPFGLAFYPRSANPRYLYVAQTDGIVRFPYRNGDLVARGEPEVLNLRLPTGEHGLPGGGHWTRDIIFSSHSSRMFISVGSATNVAESMPERSRDFIAWHEARHGRGASWAEETNRAVVLVASPDGRNVRTFATGLRNCTAMAVGPRDGVLWCANVERDRMGDNLAPDFVTRVFDGRFFGWPWFYAGRFQDPRQAGERRDLIPHLTVPSVLIQAHSSPLGITFYTSSQFPAKYRNNAFVTLRGSWNRSTRTGYKVVRIVTDSIGRTDGWYEDFLTGFVANKDKVWGRPVGIDVARDGSLLISEDGNGTIWRVSYQR